MMRTDTVTAAIAYVERGWSVVPLHSVHGDTCSCGSADPIHVRKQGGKHPLYRGWEASPLRTVEAVREAWTVRPDANVGIVTGAASGLWVLDVDPDNGGHTELAGLVTAFGVLPETYTVTTGSGGMHYYWSLPDWEPHAYRGRLPVGLDVRGWHGQVVAPPSVSGKGAYRVGSDAQVVPAPAWLLDMIRPPERVEVAASTELAPWSEGDASDSVAVVDRGRAYARSAVNGALGELAAAPPGTRNDTAFRVACRLRELTTAAWSGLDRAQVLAHFLDAAARADTDGTFPESEARAVWGKAARHATTPAELPATDMYGSAVAFSSMPPATMTFYEPGTAATGADNNGGQDQKTRATGVELAEPVAFLPDQPQDVRELAWRMWRSELAARALAESKTPPVDWAAEILDQDGIGRLPRPVALVGGWLFRDSLARVVGPSGSLKSFAVVDLGVCVAAGIPWHGNPTQRGPVLYIVAEGSSDIDVRLKAARNRYELERHEVRVIVRPVQLVGGEWRSFVAYLAGLPDDQRPALIIFDTQSRVTVGVNENDASEMGEVVAAAEDLRAGTGACVLLVHHTGLGAADRGRGSGAIFNALTTELLVKRTGMTMTVSGTKQKTIATGAELTLTAQPAIVLEPDESGMFMTPCPTLVLVSAADPDASGYALPAVDGRPAGEVRALAVVHILRTVFAEGNGGTHAEIGALFKDHPCVRDLAAGARRKAWLTAWGRLEGAWRIARNPLMARFKFVEIAGADDLAANPERLSEHGWPIATKDDKDGQRN